jgi:hypothetical protein
MIHFLLDVLRTRWPLYKAGMEKRARSLAPTSKLYKSCLDSPQKRDFPRVGATLIIHNFGG